MTMVMSLAMVSSLTIGLIAGIAYRGDLTLSTILAMSFGLIVGFLAGKPISLLTMVEGCAAGIMGGMMGAMLGDMLLNNLPLMLVFMDILFVISVLFIIFYINAELKINNKSFGFYPRSYLWMIITSAFSIIIIFTFADLEMKPVEDNQVDDLHHH
ncbi:hypothetical protein [Alteribacillus bidgolensis]|nr:hypothetical protein [Alteribacillus bidgolensis]